MRPARANWVSRDALLPALLGGRLCILGRACLCHLHTWALYINTGSLLYGMVEKE